MPAFDDARVTHVAASRDHQKGQTMTAPTVAKGQPDAAFDFDGYMSGLAEKLTETHKQLTENLAASLGDSFSAGIKAALEDIHDPQREGPQPVRASRFTVTREAPVYSLDGAGDSLVRDAWYAAREHDHEALERLRKFRLQSEDVAKLARQALRFNQSGGTTQFATVTTGTASQVIPPGYRPDLFVPMLSQGRPMVSACSQGTISNATPFVVPVFGSVTGASADHAEGVNPTDGTLTFTTKTVTPGAISGKLVLTREIVDSSNPAIDQIAFNAMRESYARQTETKVYTLVNGANGSGGTITSGFVPSGAQAATFVGSSGTPPALIGGIRGQLAKYPFSRFAAPQVGLMGQNATSILATATDSTGRPIFPSIGAMNSSGIGNAITQGWNVDGLPFIPAWAMTGVAAGDTQIAILNPLDMWVWESPLLTFRYEEKSGPALIELALFGYFATHLLRPVGLSGIRIT
jgi:HK97 family phage major capsid protein